MLKITIPNSDTTITVENPLFQLGNFQLPERAKGVISTDELADAVRKHLSGKWGKVSEKDKAANDKSVKSGGAILSAHSTKKGVQFTIVTDTVAGISTVIIV